MRRRWKQHLAKMASALRKARGFQQEAAQSTNPEFVIYYTQLSSKYDTEAAEHLAEADRIQSQFCLCGVWSTPPGLS